MALAVTVNIVLIRLFPKLGLEGSPRHDIELMFAIGCISAVGIVVLFPFARRCDFPNRIAALMLVVLPVFMFCAAVSAIATSIWR
jgi:hypothetical protein